MIKIDYDYCGPCGCAVMEENWGMLQLDEPMYYYWSCWDGLGSFDSYPNGCNVVFLARGSLGWVKEHQWSTRPLSMWDVSRDHVSYLSLMVSSTKQFNDPLPYVCDGGSRKGAILAPTAWKYYSLLFKLRVFCIWLNPWNQNSQIVFAVASVWKLLMRF